MSMKMRKYTQVVKRFSPFYLLTLLPFYLFTSLLLFSSCGTNNGKFRLEGRLRNFNNGEFWIYSPDGDMLGIDTIKVRDGVNDWLDQHGCKSVSEIIGCI